MPSLLLIAFGLFLLLSWTLGAVSQAAGLKVVTTFNPAACDKSGEPTHNICFYYNRGGRFHSVSKDSGRCRIFCLF